MMTTTSTSGIRYIHQCFLNMFLTYRRDTRMAKALKLMMVVIRFEWVNTFSTRNTIFSMVVEGCMVCSRATNPNIGTSCSLNKINESIDRWEGAVKQDGKNGAHTRMTNAMADMKPRRSARLSTTSKNPSRKIPSMNDISPA
jgi:hypothetical protein